MDITPLIHKDHNIIQSYSSKGFVVSGELYAQALIVEPEHITPWDIAELDAASLTRDHFSFLSDISERIDIVLLGTGDVSVFPSRELRDYIKSCGVTLDVMDSGAACRTYNVLMAEGRRLAAILLPTTS